MNIPQHITDLLDDYLDGSLDTDGQEQIDSWLRQSESNGKELAAWFVREVELLEAARLADLRAVFESRPFNGRHVETPDRSNAKSRQTWGAAISWLAIACSLAAVAFLRFGPTKESADDGRPSTQPLQALASAFEPAQSPPAPAILGRLAHCVWSPGMQPFRVGQDIPAGTTLEMESGLAQLVFENGAEVVLRGPCRYRIDSAMLCKLSFGSISAEVPPRAAGFTIRGPSSEVIDLGTRFGFSVGDGGTSEVHVFKGEVISRQLDEQGKVVGNEFRLREDEAVLFPGELRQAQRLAANEAKFALVVRPLWRRDHVEPLVVDHGLALWLRAAHGVETDNRNRVIAWQDLAIGDNQIANDAFQPDEKLRPLFVPNTMNGRPAIRFDGKSTHFTTTPLTTSDDQTIVVVFQHSPQAGENRIGGQIINYNGPPSRYLPDIQSPGVLQLGEKIGDRNGPRWSIAAKAYVGRDAGGTNVSAGVVRSKSLGHMQPHVVAYRYSTSQNIAALYVDGVRVARASAPTSVAVTSRKVIGKHGIFDQWYFHGDLSEIVIFNSALKPRDIKALSNQLGEYYGASRDDVL
jgi:Concanavalin A-like lectin/glucanases superfamily